MATQNFVVHSGWLARPGVQWISGEQET